MTGFIVSIVVILVAITALIVTIRKRKRIELPIFLFSIAFELLVILAAGWAFLIHGAIIEMGNM